MLTVLNSLPKGFLETPATQLYKILPGPTLIHLSGNRQPPLFVSVLLHGNEVTGFQAIQKLLQKYEGQTLPRALSLFVGNVTAARHGLRRLEDQPDYNRIWDEGLTPEHVMMQKVLQEMRDRGIFASVDVHNNTGVNPHYACINHLDHPFFHLATLFSRTVVFFTRPAGVQTSAFAKLCPAVVLECGSTGDLQGVAHAQEYLEACLHLAEIPSHPIPPHDINLFHTVATIKVPEQYHIGFGEEGGDICFLLNLDHLNFTELPVGTILGGLSANHEARLLVLDDQGKEVGSRYFSYEGNKIRTKLKVMPSMFTLDKQIIRQDCLGYLMERIPESAVK